MIESHIVAVNPFFLPEAEQFKLHGTSQVEDGKVSNMRFEAFVRKFNKPELPQIPKLNPNLDNIAKIICDYFGITMKELAGPSRKGNPLKARKIFCAIARNKTGLSLSKIGKFVNRDHCTVLSSYRSVEELRMKVNIESGMDYHYEKIIQRFE